MDLTDFDQLSPEEYNKKYQEEKQAFKDNEPRFSLNDVRELIEVLYDTNNQRREKLQDTYESWLRSHK